eukprot:PhF_6_TR35214/c1_g1_i1/m.51271
MSNVRKTSSSSSDGDDRKTTRNKGGQGPLPPPLCSATPLAEQQLEMMTTVKKAQSRVVSNSTSGPLFSAVDLDEVCHTLAFHLHCPLDDVVPFGSTALIHEFKPNQKLTNSDIDIWIPIKSFNRLIETSETFDVKCTAVDVKRVKAKPLVVSPSSPTKALIVSIPTTLAHLYAGGPF